MSTFFGDMLENIEGAFGFEHLQIRLGFDGQGSREAQRVHANIFECLALPRNDHNEILRQNQVKAVFVIFIDLKVV